MKTLAGMALGCLLLLTIAGTAPATPTVGFVEDWQPSGSLYAWTNAPPFGTGNGTLSNTGGYLVLSFPAQGFPNSMIDTIYGTGTNYTGSYTQDDLRVRFSFLAEDVLPDSSVLYMHAGASGREWTYAFDNPAVNAWSIHEVMFDYNYGHGWVGGSEAEFDADLVNIDAIGIRVYNNLDNLGQQDYGLDNWCYFVPEPGTVCLLASFFLCFGIVFRRRFPLVFAKPGG